MTLLNLALRFSLEIAALIALGYWGFRVADNALLGVLLAVAVPGAVVAVWGTLIAPRAPRRLRDPAKLGVEMVVFGAGAAALVATGDQRLALLFAVLVALNLVLMVLFGQREY